MNLGVQFACVCHRTPPTYLLPVPYT